MNGKHAPGTLLLASSPCPWCGTPAKLWPGKSRSGRGGYWAGCPRKRGMGEDECAVRPRVFYESEIGASALWSRRK